MIIVRLAPISKSEDVLNQKITSEIFEMFSMKSCSRTFLEEKVFRQFSEVTLVYGSVRIGASFFS